MISARAGRAGADFRPARPPLRRRRTGPSKVLLFLAATGMLFVAFPVVFLIVELLGQPDGAAWNALQRPRTWELVRSTLVLVAAVTAGTLAVGIPTAFLLARTTLAIRSFWMVATTLPLAIPSYVAGFAWVSFTPLRGFWGSFLVLFLVSVPYVTMPVTAALRRVDRDAESVARTLGAGPLRAFCSTTLPQIAPAAGAGALLVALYTLSDFGVVAIMRYPALTWAVQTAFSGTFNRALAIVFSLLIVALALLIVLAERAVRRRAVVYDKVRAIDDGGRWRLALPGQIAAGTGLAVVFSAAVGVPVVVLVDRILRSVADWDLEVGRLAQAAGATVAFGLAGAFLATLVALPVSILAARHRARSVSVLETGTYLGHGLPGIVLGLSMVYLVLTLAPAFYQSIGVLIVAYGILFVPKASGSVRSAIMQVPRNLEDAARTSGYSAWRTALTVTLPLAWPGIAAGAMLVALTVMKELPATLMLRPIGTDTLATRLWQLTDISAYGAAAPYAILLILVASGPVLLLAWAPGNRRPTAAGAA